MENKELSALISLLDDPDKDVFQHVSIKLASFGYRIIPTLEHAWEGSLDPMLQERIENIIHRIQFDGLLHEFKNWTTSESDDLFKGACLISRFQYPELDLKKFKDDLDRVKRAIWLELSHHLTPLEQINIFNHVFYTILQFSPKASSRNYFIHKVLENKCGNSLMLALLYLIICRDLDLPVYGVSLSHNRFILAYAKDHLNTNIPDETTRGKILFYINPLNRGAIFSRNELLTEFHKRGEKIDASELAPCSNKMILALMLENLFEIYKQEGVKAKMEEVRQLMRIVN